MGKVTPSPPGNQASDYVQLSSDSTWWKSEPDAEALWPSADTGLANHEVLPPITLLELFELSVKNNGSKPALRWEEIAEGEQPLSKPFNQWSSLDWEGYYNTCRTFGKACIAVGLEPNDAVNIFGFNAPAWAIGTFGAIFAGGKVAGLYPTDSVEQARYKCDHSNGAVALVENEVHLEKIKSVVDKLPVLKAIVVYSSLAGEDIITSDGRIVKTFTMEEFLDLGRAQEDGQLKERMANIRPGQGCCIIYTSGTTGQSKAVMISHDNLHCATTAIIKMCDCVGLSKAEERSISYLPMSHIAGLMMDLVIPLVCTANLNFKGHWCTGFARPKDLKTGKLIERMRAIKPTFYLGVPRVWEKMAQSLKAAGSKSTGMKKIMSGYATKKAALYTSTRQVGKQRKTPGGITIAKVLLKKIHTKLGLDKAKFLLVGAAPMGLETFEFFGSLGLSINEVYGMSETTAGGTWSTEKHHLWGSVGHEVPGVEVKVFERDSFKEVPRARDLFNPDESEQGEICFRGRSLMLGYMANPRLGKEHMEEVAKKNEEAWMPGGWLKSGDKGTRDERGLFRISGRYKELIITAGGENIAPVPIEDLLKDNCSMISNAVMIGNKRKCNVVLITLKTEGATGELPGTGKLAGPAAVVSDAKTIAEACEDEIFWKTIRDAISKTNKNQSVVVSNAAKIQKFSILPRDFSVETGEFTATLKLKRGVVEEVFAPILDKMYETGPEEVYVNYNLAPTPDLPMGAQFENKSSDSALMEVDIENEMKEVEEQKNE